MLAAHFMTLCVRKRFYSIAYPSSLKVNSQPLATIELWIERESCRIGSGGRPREGGCLLPGLLPCRCQAPPGRFLPTSWMCTLVCTRSELRAEFVLARSTYDLWSCVRIQIACPGSLVPRHETLQTETEHIRLYIYIYPHLPFPILAPPKAPRTALWPHGGGGGVGGLLRFGRSPSPGPPSCSLHGSFQNSSSMTSWPCTSLHSS